MASWLWIDANQWKNARKFQTANMIFHIFTADNSIGELIDDNSCQLPELVNPRLAHWGRVTQIYVGKLNHNCLR